MPSNSTSIYCSNTRQPYTLAVSWSESSSSIASNTSVISASGSLSGANVSFASSYSNFYLKLYWHDNRTNRDTHIATSGAFNSCGMGYGSRSVSGNITVTHKDDGSLSGYVRVRFESGNSSGGWAPGTSDLSTGYSALTTIARASDFNIIQGEGLLGSIITVNIIPKASNFGHKVEYSFENSSWTSVSAVSAEEGISASFYPPLTLANQIPNSTTGVLSVKVATLSGGTTIGSPVVKTVNLGIPESVVPTMDQPSHLIVSDTVPKNWNVYVKGHSSSTISINNAQGIYGSTIKSYSISGPGLSSSLASDTTNTLQTAGKNEYTCTITDSRGRIAMKTVSFNVEDYSLPSIAVDAKRCDSTGNIAANGTYLKVIVDWTISSVAGKNSVFERSVECNGVKNTTFGDNDEFILAANLSIGSTYILKAYIKDTMGLTDGKTISISTAERILNVKANKKGLAIGKFSEKDNTFEVDWKSEFNKSFIAKEQAEFKNDVKFTGTYFSMTLAIQKIIGKLMNPIGTVVINTTGINPGEYLGGTWEPFAQGRTLIGAGTGNDGSTSMSFTALSEIGEYSHKLTIDEIPSHNHGALYQNEQTGPQGTEYAQLPFVRAGGQKPGSKWFPTSKAGLDKSHNIIQPSIVVYVWNRIA